MNASAKRTIRLGLTVGLSLGAIVGIVGCSEQTDDAESDSARAVESQNGFSLNGWSMNGWSMNGLSVNGWSMNGLSANGFSLNGLSVNGLSVNGLSANGLSVNGLSVNGLESSSPLSSTSGLMTTPGGREIVKYMVKVAYPNGSTFTKNDQFGNSYTFQGGLGVAPELEFNTCDAACQEKVSGAMLAHVNNSGLHVGIWLDGPDNGIGWGSDSDYPYQEGAYFGNLFASNMPGNYCAGKSMAAGDAKGRLGSPFGNNNAVMNSPYGWQTNQATGAQVPQYCTNGCQTQNEGFSSCYEPSTGKTWSHVTTVWRNFEPTQLYKICNRQTLKCLGVVGGSTSENANLEQRTFSAAAGQTWQILQVSPGNYKIVNKTSGKALDGSGTQVVQKSFTGASSQLFPITYFQDQTGWANLRVASQNSYTAFWPANGSANDGTLIQNAQNSSSDASKWMFEAIALSTFDPGMTYRMVPQQATGSSIDVAYGSQNNGTMVQQYSSWATDGQKFAIVDAGHGNVKIVMKANRNKCIGPVANGTNPGTMMEVQDCNGSYNQQWVTGEMPAGSGMFGFRNAAATNLCLDVTGNTNANGARMELYTCTGGNNQKFQLVAAP